MLIFLKKTNNLFQLFLKLEAQQLECSKFCKIKHVLNKELDSKINQLNSIFDLGKEFSSILEIERVSKLLSLCS